MTAEFDPQKHIRIHRNDSEAQIVEILSPKSEIWVISYTGEPIDIKGKEFNPEKPGIYLVEKDSAGLISKIYKHFAV